MNLGSKIVELRKSNKMSQEDFAEIFHVSRQTISNWENSKSYPDIQTLVKMSDTFDVSLDVLLKEDKELIRKIDKGLKDYKIVKRVLLFLGGILLIGGIIFSIDCYRFSKKYEAVKNEIEPKYYKALENHHFKKDGRLYTLTTTNHVKFVAGSQEMPKKADRVLHFYAQFLDAYIDKQDSTIEIIFNDFNDFAINKFLKDKEETMVFSTDNMNEKDRKNIEVISEKVDCDTDELEQIINQGYEIYNDLYSSKLAE